MTKKYTYLVSFGMYTEQLVAVYDNYETMLEGLPHNHATLSADLFPGDGYDNDGVFKWGWELGNCETEDFPAGSFPVAFADSTATWYHEHYDEPRETLLRIERWETNWYERHQL